MPKVKRPCPKAAAAQRVAHRRPPARDMPDLTECQSASSDRIRRGAVASLALATPTRRLAFASMRS